MNSNDFVTMFFLVAAVLIFWQLRRVLGQRTGTEKPPYDPFTARERAKEAEAADDSKVVTLPKRDELSAENRFSDIDAVAPVGSKANDGLRAVAEQDLSFNAKTFMQGAKSAYEMIVVAFADGDRASLKNLLSAEVYEGFDAAIKDRESRGETVRSTFVGIDKAEVTDAGFADSEAFVTIRVASQLISATYDKNGELVDGDADSVADVNDVWTFARDVRSNDPNWKLVATESE